MTVHIQRATSDVTAQPEPAKAAPAKAEGWRPEDLDQARALHARMQRDALRVRAEGFDD